MARPAPASLQYYFILRVLVTSWDYSFEVRDRDTYSHPKAHFAIATGILVAIIVLQILNSLLVSGPESRAASISYSMATALSKSLWSIIALLDRSWL